MDYQSALDYILSFSDYERHPGAGYAERWDLRRMEELLERLGSPHLRRRTVHVAGSKGKGSTAAMVAAALSAAGFKTGLYTSPHLHTMRERIRVGSDLITEEQFALIVEKMAPAIQEQNQSAFGELSTFEILTAAAFCYFQEQGADFQVLETGLGGRLDATNIVPHPDVCLLTSISLDHTAVLGDTVAKIATEKCGIIKPGVTVVSAPQVQQAARVICDVCQGKGARLITAGEDVSWEEQGSDIHQQYLRVRGLKGTYDVSIPLLGEHQLQNAATAVIALEVLDIDARHMASGLARVDWPGRLQVLRESPLLIADGAHNGDSARKLKESLLKYFKFNRSFLIMGTSADKNSGAMIAELAPFFDTVITTTSEHPRATPAADLAAEFSRHGVTAMVVDGVVEAISRALALAGDDDLICATGSLFLVAEVIEKARGIAGERYPRT